MVGNDGSVVVINGVTGEKQVSYRMAGAARCVGWDGDDLMAAGTEGEIWTWDMRMNGKPKKRIKVDDGTPIQCLAAVGGRVAAGCESGVVSVYKDDQLERR